MPENLILKGNFVFKCSNVTLLINNRVLKIKELEVKKFVKETQFSQIF
jgi:hypothetical protein